MADDSPADELQFVGLVDIVRSEDDGVSVLVTPGLEPAGVDAGARIGFETTDDYEPSYIIGTGSGGSSRGQVLRELYRDGDDVWVDLPARQVRELGIEPWEIGPDDQLQLYAAPGTIAVGPADDLSVVVEQFERDVDDEGVKNFAGLAAVEQYVRTNRFEVYFDREAPESNTFEVRVRPFEPAPYDQMPRAAVLGAVEALRAKVRDPEVDVTECVEVVSEDAYGLTVPNR